MIRLSRRRLLILLLLPAAAGLFLLSVLIPVNPSSLYSRLGFPYRFYDRYGNLLHAGLSSNGFLYEPVDIADVPVHTVAALVLLEDRRFFTHAGIDLRALGRAVWSRVSGGGGRSGASTLTMQLARNVFGWPRHIFAKMVEAWYALRLEQSFTKQQLLQHYFNTIPFGRQIIGIQTAARSYFGRPVEKLSPAQGAYLAALVKFPAYTDSPEHRRQVRARQLQALRLLREDGVLGAGEWEQAVREKITVRPLRLHRIAPHFTDLLLQRLRRLYPDSLDRITAVHTTLDLTAQQDCAAKAAEVVRGLTNKRISNAAVVLLDNRDCSLRALVGSIDYYSSRAGQVNGALALRSPGSSLKPFIYAAAFERGLAAPGTPVADVKTDFYSRGGDYNPENYSRTFHGPVSVRQALACSYNIPAVKMLRRTGVVQVLQDLQEAGFSSLDKGADWYGLTLALGGGNVTLLELAAGYSTLAAGGVYRPVKMITRIETRSGVDLAPPVTAPVRVYSRGTAFLIGDILDDNDARSAAFSLHSPLRMPFYCAVKTGTSKGFRDNWTAGYTKAWTLAVWVGNFDNSPMEGVSGISGAAPLFRRILLAREHDYDWRPSPPETVGRFIICPVSGMGVGADCPGSRDEWFFRDRPPLKKCDWHFRVPYRSDGSVFWHRGNRKPVLWKRVTYYPAVYLEWLRGTGQGLPDNDLQQYLEWRKNGVRPAPSRPRVLFPDDGDIFAVDPILPLSNQRLTMRAEAPGAPQQIYWVLNATNRIAVQYPWQLAWPLQRGRWRIEVEAVWNGTNRIRSKPVFMQVF